MSEQKTVKSEDLKATIREAGLRATPARIATLKLLHDASSPMSHAEVAESLDEFGVDKATAFRNLNDLAAAGILVRTELGDHVWRFELNAHGDAKHPHFICVDCGNVSCLDDVKLTANSLRVSQAVGEVTEILLRGHCNDCN
ncbi:MAG: Fur family transcriptional regulator [Planctomycetota bacterium]